MNFETLITSTLSDNNLQCHPHGSPSVPDAECLAILAANELALGLPPGSILLIAKVEGISDGDPVSLTAVQSPFNVGGVDLEASWSCVDAAGLNPTDGCTLQLNFEDLENDWQIVKIIAKGGNGGTTNNVDGVFARSNALLTSGVEDLQAAFISEAERNEWLTSVGLSGSQLNNGRYSHLYVFGVESTPEEEQEEKVPEPGTVMLLGVGLLGLGAAFRSRCRR